MSFLTLPNGVPSFDQAVISFWFRVPTESLDAASAALDDGSTTVSLPDGRGSTQDFFIPPPLNGIIPLMTFGDPTITGYIPREYWNTLASYTQEYLRYDTIDCAYHEVHPPTAAILSEPQTMRGPAINLDPCYIGIDATNRVLTINIQYPDVGKGSWVRSDVVAISPDPLLVDLYSMSGISGVCGGDEPVIYKDSYGNQCLCHPSSAPFMARYTWGDFTDMAFDGAPEAFNVELLDWVEPDRWHHVLLSFDLSGGIAGIGNLAPSTSPGELVSTCLMWAAVDDIDQDLSTNMTRSFGLGPNQLATDKAGEAAILSNTVAYTYGPFCVNPRSFSNTGYAYGTTGSGGGLPTYRYSPPPISTDGFPLGIPSTPRYLDNVYPVEMAEFQMWTGITLDTSDETNRRAFIDADGLPVSPNKKKTKTDPQSGSIELLGKNPDILLTGSGNWIAGKNTGTKTELNEIGKPVELPADNLDPTGVIVAYTPDPSLNGTQSPPPQPPALLNLR